MVRLCDAPRDVMDAFKSRQRAAPVLLNQDVQRDRPLDSGTVGCGVGVHGPSVLCEGTDRFTGSRDPQTIMIGTPGGRPGAPGSAPGLPRAAGSRNRVMPGTISQGTVNPEPDSTMWAAGHPTQWRSRCLTTLGDDTMTSVATSSEQFIIDATAQDVLFRQARTANTFTDQPVSDEQIRAIYDLVKWAPTSFNQQPLRVVLVRSPDARKRLVSLMMDNNKAKTMAAPLVAILAADTDFHEHLPTQFPVFPQAKDVFFADDMVREASARMNAGLQVGYFILGVRAAGLAAGPMAGFDAGGVSSAFFPDGKSKALVVVNIGRPAQGAWRDRLPRLTHEQVFSTV